MLKVAACSRCGKGFCKTSRHRTLCDDCTQTNSFEKRFWSKVDKSGSCWIWKASLDKGGYGQVMLNKTPHRAHRISWSLVNGEIPIGIIVCHKCDNPPCVNPSHLSLGTFADNTADMDRKGRRINVPHPGEKHGMHILTEKQARVVLERALSGENQWKIAADFGISNVTVCAIKTRRIWRCLG